ncbi:MAG: tetratricopeptide repeat protein [Firmicutes bacterium]|nr:tetratricopeptide repeat protein [Bacillota bacterium]
MAAEGPGRADAARLQEAIEALRGLVERKPRDLTARRALAAALLEAGRPAEAREQLRACEKMAPKDDLVLYLLGVAEAEAGDLDAAIAAWRKLARRRASHAGAHYMLGRAYAAKRMWDAAVHHLNLAAEHGDEAATSPQAEPGQVVQMALEALAELHLARGQADKAVKTWERMLERDPNQVTALNNLAAAHLTAGRLAEAEAYAARAREAGADNAAFHYNLGQIALRKGDYLAAASHFAAAAERDPRDASLRVNLGDAWVRAGRRAEARAAWEEALRLEPGHPDAHFNLGVEAARDGDIEGALRHWTAVVERVPQFSPAWAHQVDLLLSRGREAEALEVAERWTRARPSDAWAWQSLAWARLAAGHGPKAAAAIRQAETLAPTHPRLALLKCAADAAAGRAAEAAAHLARAPEPQSVWPGERAVLARLGVARLAAVAVRGLDEAAAARVRRWLEAWQERA